MFKVFKYISFVLIFVILTFVFIKPSYAQVVINEFNSYDSSDWVELYSPTDVDVSGWILRDSATSIVATIPVGITVGPSNNYYIIEASNRLNIDSDTVRLYQADDITLVNQIEYGTSNVCAPGSGQTIGRNPDGGSIARFALATKSQSNIANIAPCPTATPTATSTSSPTPSSSPSPTPTKTPTATPKPTPTKTPTPKKSFSPSPSPSAEAESTSSPEILGLSNESPSPTPLVEGDRKVNFPLIASFLIIAGIVCIGIPVVWYFKSKTRYNDSSQ